MTANTAQHHMRAIDRARSVVLCRAKCPPDWANSAAGNMKVTASAPAIERLLNIIKSPLTHIGLGPRAQIID